MADKFCKISDECFVFECPGCGYDHAVNPNRWEFNFDLEKPTVTPSLLVNKDRPDARCHSFIRDGKIEFLPDSFHALAGKTVEIPDYEM